MSAEKRIRRLERENRWHRVCLVLMLLVLVASCARQGVPGATEGDELAVKTLVAREIRIGEEESGSVVISAEGPGGLIRIHDQMGNTLVVLGRDEEGHGAIATYDGAGVKLVSVGATSGGRGVITTFNGAGEKLVSLVPNAAGNGAVVTYNGRGKELVSVGTTSTGGGAIAVFEEAGGVRAVWP